MRRKKTAGMIGGLAAVAAYDLIQRRHAILRTFPVIGHGRYMLESIGPELRQYIVAANKEERPFSRDQRRWVYASAKGQINTFAFGTDADLKHAAGHLTLRTVAQPAPPPPDGHPSAAPLFEIPCAKVLGGAHRRRRAFRPRSIINISGMSFGSLSAAAVEAMNRGAALAGALHNTGEGGLAAPHRHGADLIFQIGTGYFGCRDADGHFSLPQLMDRVAEAPVKAIEIKLSQGAKPGLGGMLPAAKVTEEIAAVRGVTAGRDCVSPASHSAFRTPRELLEFVELIAAETGLPVGVKTAVGDLAFWEECADLMAADRGRGLDFLTVDGGEGGTGAAPLSFSDHAALPFKVGFPQLYRVFASRGLHQDVVFIGSGRLGFPEQVLCAMALGCDMVNVGREAMLAVGCIQAQRCHTGRCPAGVATQSRWLMRGLDPTDKAARTANYLRVLRSETLELARALGVPHPALVSADHVDVLQDGFEARPLREVVRYPADLRKLSAEQTRFCQQ